MQTEIIAVCQLFTLVFIVAQVGIILHILTGSCVDSVLYTIVSCKMMLPVSCLVYSVTCCDHLCILLEHCVS